MNKILLSGGDSFTWGNELSDSVPNFPSKLSWASILAKEINYDYSCVAKAGGGNHAITRRVIDYCESSCVDLVSVMWTFPVRHEIGIRQDIAHKGKDIELTNDELDNGWLNLTYWQGLDYEEKLPQYGEISRESSFQNKLKELCDWHKHYGIYDVAKSWFEIISEQHHIQTTLESIIILQTYLEKNNIPYIFSAATNQIYDLINSNHPLAKMIDKTKWINNIGFFEWAKQQNYKLSPMKHPEDRAHRDWIDIFYKDVIEKYKQ